MVLYEVLYRLNDTDKYYISDIGILLQYWKRSNVMQMVRFTGLQTLCYYAIKAEDIKFNYPYTLELYIIRSSIGVKSSRKVLYSREHENWLKWAENFINYNIICISRLVRILVIDSLQEVLGYQANQYIPQPLRFKRLFRLRVKKPSEVNSRLPDNGNLKYVIRVPTNTKESPHLYK